MASWKIVAQTEVVQHNNDSYQVLVYVYTALTVTPTTMKLMGDIKMTRGVSSPKTKLTAFAITKFDFQLLEESSSLQNALAGYDDVDIAGVIKKNGSNYFIGKLSIKYPKKYLDKGNLILNMTFYDGIEMLKTFTDISDLPSGNQRLSEFVRYILNKLNSNLNIKVISDIYANPCGITPNLIYDTGTRREYLIAKDESTTFYNILENICFTFDLTLFQHEATWYFRQNSAIKSGTIGIFTINYLTGGLSSSTINLEEEAIPDDFQKEATYYEVVGINGIVSTVSKKEYDVKQPFDIGWLNSEFLEGATGWTVTGTATFNNGGVNIAYGSTIEQLSEYIFSVGDEIVIDFQCFTNKWLDTYGDLQYTVASVTYIGEYDTYSLLPDGTWDSTTPYYFEINLSVPFSTGSYAACYYYGKLAQTIKSSPVNLDMGAGKIKVTLYSGAEPTYNYPLEISAQFTYFRLRFETNNDLLEPPTELVVHSQIANTDDYLTNNLDYHDNDVMHQSSYINMYDDSETIIWYPNDKSLLETRNVNLLNFNNGTMKALDFKLLPKNLTNFNFSKLLKYATNNYLPMFEESWLISNSRRFIVIQHEEANPTITTEISYTI